MKIFKTAVKAILVFDAAYLCFVCAEDVCSRIRSRMRKKNKTEPEPYFFDDEEEDTDYYLTPALCMDSLRLLHRGDVMDFIKERIIPKEKAVFQALTETEQEMTKLLLASCIGLLVEEAPYDERSFPTLLDVLEYCTGEDEPDAVDILMQENGKKQDPKPEYFCRYQKYKLACQNKARIIDVCRVIVNDILAELYHGYYNVELDSLLYEPVSKKLSKTAFGDADWEVDEDALSDC